MVPVKVKHRWFLSTSQASSVEMDYNDYRCLPQLRQWRHQFQYANSRQRVDRGS